MSTFNHPRREEFEAVVMADQVLSQLFPIDHEATGRSGYVLASTGRGSSIQLSMFAETILRKAWRDTRGDGHPTISQLMRLANDQLRFIRSAVAGDDLEVWARISLTGVTIPEDQEIQVPFGRLRQVRPADHAGLPIDLSGQLTATHGDEQVTISYSGDVVLETPIRYRIRISEQAPEMPEWPEDSTTRSSSSTTSRPFSWGSSSRRIGSRGRSL
jgi:hypothetical protein